ncbi:MAG: hypothetical protein H6604_09730 [Flavobacteriales bacterium]|nr:hypothetical protein [Flavobacteriales bacterium]
MRKSITILQYVLILTVFSNVIYSQTKYDGISWRSLRNEKNEPKQLLENHILLKETVVPFLEEEKNCTIATEIISEIQESDKQIQNLINAKTQTTIVPDLRTEQNKTEEFAKLFTKNKNINLKTQDNNIEVSEKDILSNSSIIISNIKDFLIQNPNETIVILIPNYDSNEREDKLERLKPFFNQLTENVKNKQNISVKQNINQTENLDFIFQFNQ